MEGLISSASWPYRVVSICNHYLAVSFVDGVLVRLLNIDFCYTDSARIVVFFLCLSDADRLVAVSACWPYSVVADTGRLVTPCGAATPLIFVTLAVIVIPSAYLLPLPPAYCPSS